MSPLIRSACFTLAPDFQQSIVLSSPICAMSNTDAPFRVQDTSKEAVLSGAYHDCLTIHAEQLRLSLDTWMISEGKVSIVGHEKMTTQTQI